MMPPSLNELAARLGSNLPRTVRAAVGGCVDAQAILRVAHARILGKDRALADWRRCSVLDDVATAAGDAPGEVLTHEIGVGGMTQLIDCAPAAFWLDAYDRGYREEVARLNQQETPK